MRKRVGLSRALSPIVGTIIFVIIMAMFTSLFIYMLDRVVNIARESFEKVREAGETVSSISSLKALWSFNKTHITIYIENQVSKTVLLTAIAIVYSDGSYTTISRVNRSIDAKIVIGSRVLNKLDLPLGIAPATTVTITLSTKSKTPVAVSLAVEASPIAVIQAVTAKIAEIAETRTSKITPSTTLGTTTWLGIAAIPTTRNATPTKTYPQDIVSRGMGTTIVRTSRGALVYTDFETTPSGWASRGGNWTIIPGGYRGNALLGTDNNTGIGKASQYYYNYDLSTYNSLWVSTKVRLVSDTGSAGIYMINLGGNRLYAIEITADGFLQVRSFAVDAKGWKTLGSTKISGFARVNWYTIVVSYSANARSLATFNVYVYDTTGTVVASLTNIQSKGKKVFVPAYIGVGVDDAVALFDDFIVSTVDPRTIVVANLPEANYRVEIYDNFGNPIGNATSDKTGIASVNVVKDIVVGTGVDGSIKVYDNLILSYTLPDNILGGDTYRYVIGMYTATFSDTAQLSNVIELFRGNLTLNFTTNTSITLSVSVNGVQIYSSNFTAGSYNLVIPLPSTVLGATNTFDIVLYIISSRPFKVTVQNLNLAVFGYFSDFVEKVLLVGTGTNIYFYNVTMYLPSFTPSYIVNAFTSFSGQAAITYDSSQYLLYMVNASGIYSWNPLGWSFVDDVCNATSVGTRIELVNSDIVVLPMVLAGTSYVCVYDLTIGNATLYTLPAGYIPYSYTSSAIVKDSVLFTALDSSARVVLLMFNTTSSSFKVLDSIPSYCVVGLASDGLKVYAVLCGFWGSALNFDNSNGIAVWIYDLRTSMSGIVVVSNSTAVKLFGYSDRVEVDKDQNILLVVDEDKLHVIDIQILQLMRKAVVYSV